VDLTKSQYEMKKTINHSSTKLMLPVRCSLNRYCLLVVTLWLGLVGTGLAQVGSQGNTTIFANGQLTIFGNHNFVTGGSGAQPGVILTERATGSISYLNFVGNGLTTTGADDANYVDGYVRKYGTGQFIFPVGDNANYGPFAANADGTSGAYFRANPATAITSNLFTGTNYPVLPNGGPFPATLLTRGPAVKAVSNVEYWDIDGATATPITLTWDATSNVNTLTGGQLTTLTIVGWDGTKWMRIPSTSDATSVLGGTSSVTEGSITTTASIVPDTYIAYTLAAVGPDVTPRISVVPNIVSGTQRLEVVLSVLEAGTIAPTNGQVTIRMAKNSLLSNFEWTPTQTTAPASGNISVQNSIWTASESDPGYYTFTTTTSIPRSSQRRLVFYLTLTPGGTDGTFSLPVNIPAGQGGGEVNLLNNQDAELINYLAN
jgi:hypothetical protein